MISPTPATSKTQSGTSPAVPKAPRDRSGFAFLLIACFLTCVMLVANGALVSMAYPAVEQFCNWIASFAPWLLSGPRLVQIMILALPVALIFGEWWLFDIVVDYARRPRANETRKKSR